MEVPGSLRPQVDEDVVRALAALEGAEQAAHDGRPALASSLARYAVRTAPDAAGGALKHFPAPADTPEGRLGATAGALLQPATSAQSGTWQPAGCP